MTVGVNVNEPVKQMTIEAIIIRKDGTREDLGVVSYYHKNPIKRLLWNVKKVLVDWYNKRVSK